MHLRSIKVAAAYRTKQRVTTCSAAWTALTPGTKMDMPWPQDAGTIETAAADSIGLHFSARDRAAIRTEPYVTGAGVVVHMAH